MTYAARRVSAAADSKLPVPGSRSGECREHGPVLPRGAVGHGAAGHPDGVGRGGVERVDDGAQDRVVGRGRVAVGRGEQVPTTSARWRRRWRMRNDPASALASSVRCRSSIASSTGVRADTTSRNCRRASTTTSRRSARWRVVGAPDAICSASLAVAASGRSAAHRATAAVRARWGPLGPGVSPSNRNTRNPSSRALSVRRSRDIDVPTPDSPVISIGSGRPARAPRSCSLATTNCRSRPTNRIDTVCLRPSSVSSGRSHRLTPTRDKETNSR